MRVVPVDHNLVRVDGWLRERYATRTPHGWCWDATGRAVCPITAATIRRQLERI